MGLLVRCRPQGGGVAPVGVLDLAPTLAIFGVEEVAKDREQPGVQIGAGLESVDVGERPQERVLDEVVGAVDIPGQGDAESAQARNAAEERLTHVERRFHGQPFVSSSLPSRSSRRCGTGWRARSTYMARSSRPMRSRAVRSRVGVGSEGSRSVMSFCGMKLTAGRPEAGLIFAGIDRCMAVPSSPRANNAKVGVKVPIGRRLATARRGVGLYPRGAGWCPLARIRCSD